MVYCMRFIFVVLLCLLSHTLAAHDFGGSVNIEGDDLEKQKPDEACKEIACQCDRVGKPIAPWDGGENYSHIDLTLGVNFPIRIQRHYDSQSTYDTPLGYGWAFVHDRRIFEYPNGTAVLRRSCGKRALFLPAGGSFFTDRDSVQGILTRHPDGSYTFEYYNGQVDQFDAEGRLTHAVSREGWQHEFLYSSNKQALVGTSEYSVNPDQPLTAAYVYQLNRIQLRSPDGQLTGYFVDFSYDPNTGRLTKLVANDGRELNYQHDSYSGSTRGNLIHVDGLDNLSMHYQYQDPLDHHNVTHFQESDVATPYINVYDEQDRVVSQTHGNQSLSFAYPQPSAVSTVTRVVRDDQGTVLHTAVSTYEYDEAGYLTKLIDALGHEQRHFYSSNKDRIKTEVWESTGTGLMLQKTTEWAHDALGNATSETITLDSGETITTTWTYDHGRVNSRQRVSSTAPTKVFRTEYSFYRDAQNIPLRIHQVKRINTNGPDQITSYTYCDSADIGQAGSTCPFEGLVKSIDGPRTDVNDITHFSYYAADDTSGCANNGPCHLKGQLHTVTNALGHVTTTTRYTLAGDVAQVQDANGLFTDYEYHPRRWVTAIKVRGTDPNTENDDLITLNQYDAAGNLIQRTAPDGSVVSFSYDARFRLTGITDGLNNEIRYTLDTEGNRLKEENYDPADTLTYRLSRQFDAINRQQSQISAAGEVTSFGYDAVGNLVSSQDPIAGINPNQQVYDDLDRLIQSTDALSGITHYAYDANDNLTQVTDPNGNSTLYSYDELSRLTTLNSPDTGITQYQYDIAGNRTQQTDARNVVANYSYDALNRVTNISYPSDAGLNVSYTYDQGTNGIGRLTGMSDGSGSTSWSYDLQGRIVSKTQIVGSVSLTLRYQYNASGQLSDLIYPDGTKLSYSYDSVGRIVAASVTPSGGTAQPLINAIDYLPFGPISKFDYAGNYPDQDRYYDLDYRPTGLMGPLARTYTTDPIGNITAITKGADTWHYGYDHLYRLLGVEQPINTSLQSYTYDANGNRTSKNGTAYSIDTNSNRINQIGSDLFAYDAMGNTTSMPNDNGDILTMAYGAHQRLIQSSNSSGAIGNYTYNGRGERVKKQSQASPSDPSETRLFFYGENGQLLGEYDAVGSIKKQYLWLGAQLAGISDSLNVYAIHTDHLTTPRAVADSLGTTVWRWDSEATPFGDGDADEDPDGNGTGFELNLRFPGQYSDLESLLYYNYFRDYGPGIGRYVESDPIGLDGGLNTYAYVNLNVFNIIDPSGLNGIAVLPRPIFVPRPLPLPASPIDPFLPIVMPQPNVEPIEECSSEKECDPPKGTLCYELNSGHKHKGLDPHYHTWQMNQRSDGTCIWNKKLSKKHTYGNKSEIAAGILDCNVYQSWRQQKAWTRELEL